MGTMPPPVIRARFRRSGGFAGIPLTATVTADELGQEHAAQLRELLTAGSQEQAPEASGGGGADRFQYELDLDDGQHHRSFSWNESRVPEPVRPLLAALTRRARPGPG